MSSVFTKNLRREILRREQVAVGAVTEGRMLTWRDLFQHLTDLGIKDVSPIRTAAAMKAILARLDAVGVDDRAHVVVSRAGGKRSFTSCVLSVAAGSHPLVDAEADCLIAHGCWIETGRRYSSVLSGFPLAVLSRHAVARLTERSRDPFGIGELVGLLLNLGRFSVAYSDGDDFSRFEDRNFVLRIADTIFAGAMRLAGNGGSGRDACAGWLIDIRTVLSPEMLSSAELHQAEATGLALGALVDDDFARARALMKALPIVPARKEDFIAESATRFAMGEART